jgi:hypothetical protein
VLRIDVTFTSQTTTQRFVVIVVVHEMQKQIDALKELCMKAGVSEDDIQACTPRSEYKDRRTSFIAGHAWTIEWLFSIVDTEN